MFRMEKRYKKSKEADKMNCKPHSQETKIKIALANKGKIVSDETKKKMSLAHLGRKHTAESILKIRNSKLGNKHTEQAKKKMSLAHKGKALTSEHKLKLSLIRKGKFLGDKNPMFGKKFSEETRKKMSESMNGLKRTEEQNKANSLRMKKLYDEGKFISYFNDKTNEKYYAWKGNKVKYRALHSWIHRHKPKPLNNECEHCKNTTKRLQASNISGKYLRDINDFKWLCGKCHSKYDEEIRFKIGEWSVVKANIKNFLSEMM